MSIKEVLSKLQVVIILGYPRTINGIAQGLDQHAGIRHISIMKAREKAIRRGEPNKSSFELFMEQAAMALKDGIRTVVGSGIPDNYNDANRIADKSVCPTLLVLHHDENPEAIYHRARGVFGTDGMGNKEFRRHIEALAVETSTFKHLLSNRGIIERIHGLRPQEKQREFLHSQVLAFHRKHTSTATIRAMHNQRRFDTDPRPLVEVAV